MIKCLDHDPDNPHQEKRCEMAYEAVKEYAYHEQERSFNLPKEIGTLVELDLKFKDRCDKTLKKLKRKGKLANLSVVCFLPCCL